MAAEKGYVLQGWLVQNGSEEAVLGAGDELGLTVA